jgi:hypothetical protein
LWLLEVVGVVVHIMPGVVVLEAVVLAVLEQPLDSL